VEALGVKQPVPRNNAGGNLDYHGRQRSVAFSEEMSELRFEKLDRGKGVQEMRGGLSRVSGSRRLPATAGCQKGVVTRCG